MILIRWLCILWILCAFSPATGAESRSIDVNGRDFILFEPAKITTPLPLIIVLHGAFGNGRWMARNLPLFRFVEIQKFRVAYLSATKTLRPSGRRVRIWNDGACCGENLHPNVDDVAYISAVLGKLDSMRLVTKNNVTLVGHSNGAKMAYRAICEIGAQFSALVAISGARVADDCTSAVNTRVLHIHGVADRVVPITGGRGAFDPRVVHDSLPNTARMMQSVGADFRQIKLTDTGHRLNHIDGSLKSASGTGLPKTILNFVFPR